MTTAQLIKDANDSINRIRMERERTLYEGHRDRMASMLQYEAKRLARAHWLAVSQTATTEELRHTAYMAYLATFGM